MYLNVHDKYNKLIDNVYNLGYATRLNFIVVLSKELKTGERYPYHHEYEYYDKKFSNTKNLITIKRDFDYYLSLEFSTYQQKEFIMIRVENILLIRSRINYIINNWIGKNIYGKKDGNLIIIKKVNSILINGLPLDKFIRLEPVIINYTNTQQAGVRIYLNSNDIYVDMTIDKFMGFAYTIESINMYESAQLLLNYMGRPEYGHNLINYNQAANIDDIVDEGIESVEVKGKGRKIELKNKSIFDKIDDL